MPISLRRCLTTLIPGLGLLLATPVFAGELHDVTPAPGKTKAGTPGKASVTLTTKNGWKLNAEAPMSLKLAPAPGVTVDKAKFTRKDLALSTTDKARFDIGFQADAPGTKSIEAEANFVICQESACKPVKETVTVQLDVEANKKK